MFGKITVIKTLCLPKLNHIVSVVPNPSLTHLKLLESELKMFISDNNPNIVDETTRHMAKNMVDLRFLIKIISGNLWDYHGLGGQSTLSLPGISCILTKSRLLLLTQ